MNLKSSLFKSALCALALAFGMTSCSDDNEPGDDPKDFTNTETLLASEADLDYDADGVWARNDESGFINIGDYEFSHSIDEYDWVWGFTASKLEDDNEYNPGYEHPYAVIYNGSFNSAYSPYLVGAWNTSETDDTAFDDRSCRMYDEEGELFMPQSITVNNNTYAYYVMLNGNDFTKKFDDNDWFKLIINGVHQDGSVASVEVYLANEGKIMNQWTDVDLSGLGICTGLYFTMASSSNNEWGMLTPGYFCVGKLVVKN